VNRVKKLLTGTNIIGAIIAIAAIALSQKYGGDIIDKAKAALSKFASSPAGTESSKPAPPSPS